jgi:cysteine/O-acetylserine efflux protein
MDAQAISAFLAYAVINAITPGPGNILALNTMGTYGWKKGKRLLFGVFAGYYFTQICCAIFTCGLMQLLGSVISILKYVGGAYILWLAVHIARSKPSVAETEKKASFLTGFILQCVNVKILLFGITALTGYVVPYFTTLKMMVLFSLIIATIGSMATIIWCVFGAIFQRYYQKFFRPVNIVLAITLVWCAISLLFH